MYKKGNKIKLTEQKGITAADAVIAMLIILTALGVITMVYTNLIIGSRGVDRKAGATRIATNVLENMSQYYFDEIKQKMNGHDIIGQDEYSVPGGEGQSIYNTSIPEGYTLKIKFENESGVENLAFKATVGVEYSVNESPQKVELTKVFSREISRECNSPNFDDEYLSAAGILSAKLYSNRDTTSTNYYICPVQYDGNYYKILSKEELYDGNLQKIWYSYSNRQWARILVLTQAELNSCTSGNIIEDSQYISKYLRDVNKSYIWVPRYGIKDGTDEVYFKYQDTENAILSENENENEFFYYIDTKNRVKFSDNYSDIDFGNKKGKWMRYDKLNKFDTNGSDNELYRLNYMCGPLIEY